MTAAAAGTVEKRAARDALIDAFLNKCGWGAAQRRLLAGDASFRRYERIVEKDRTSVLMDAPPDREDVRPFVKVDELLCHYDFSAPRILGRDENTGLLLLEDLGDDLFTRVLSTGIYDEQTLYAPAIDALVRIRDEIEPEGITPYDDDKLLIESELFTQWYMPQLLGGKESAELNKEFSTLIAEVLPLARRGVPDALVLRDYHADNLIWLPEREADQAVGLLDFQDAVVGPVTYDLVSLLEDARRDVLPQTVEAMLDRYLAASPKISRDDFLTSYAVMGAQRNLKIIGIFVRLCVRDGKRNYLPFLPRVWRNLENDLQHPAMAPIKDWINRHVPANARAELHIG